MTEKLRLIYSDEEVADYLRWILSKQPQDNHSKLSDKGEDDKN